MQFSTKNFVGSLVLSYDASWSIYQVEGFRKISCGSFAGLIIAG